MSLAFRSWLPPGTAMPRLAQGAIADMVDAWSQHWFAKEPMRLLGSFAKVDKPRNELRKLCLHASDGIALGIPDGALTALGEQVMGLIPGSGDRSGADLELLDKLGSECLDDLKHRAAALFHLAKGAAWSVAEASPAPRASHRAEIGNGARLPTLTLELSDALHASFVKSRLAPAPKPGPLGAPADALAAVPVSLSAIVGRCGITVAELSGLAEGDVLVLDRALDAPLPLAIGGRRALRGTCKVSAGDDALALQISQSPAE